MSEATYPCYKGELLEVHSLLSLVTAAHCGALGLFFPVRRSQSPHLHPEQLGSASGEGTGSDGSQHRHSLALGIDHKAGL